MQVISFKLEVSTIEALDTYAIRHGLNRSEAIRKAIITFLKDNNDKINTEKQKGMLKVVSFKIEEDLLQQLQKFAQEHNLSISAVVKAAINNALKNHHDNHETLKIKIEKFRLF